MRKIEVLRDGVKELTQLAETPKVEEPGKEITYPEKGYYFPLSFLQELLEEIEDLERRCGELE